MKVLLSHLKYLQTRHISLLYLLINLLGYIKVFLFYQKMYVTYAKLSLQEHLDCVTRQSNPFPSPYQESKPHTFKMTYFLLQRYCGNLQWKVKTGFLEVKSKFVSNFITLKVVFRIIISVTFFSIT